MRESDSLLPVTEAKPNPWSVSKVALSLVGVAVLGGTALSVSQHSVLNKDTSLETTLPVPTTIVKPNYGSMSDAQIEALFDKFISDFEKPYKEVPETKAERFLIFKANLLDIDSYNAWNPRALFGITQRADWTEEERQKVRGLKSHSLSQVPGETRSSWQIMKDNFPDQSAISLGEQGVEAVIAAGSAHNKLEEQLSHTVEGRKMSKGMFPWITVEQCAACNMFPDFSKYTIGNLPTNFDWRDLGAVGEVENQAYCGSCWTFSTAQDIAGTHFLAHGELTRYSEQQLVACDVENDGCDGGWPFRAMQYITKIGGMVTYEDYPYKGICAWDACGTSPTGGDFPTPTCDTSLLDEEIEAKNAAGITGYQLVGMGAEFESLVRLSLVKNGPLSMAFDASGMDYYEHGITGCDTGTEYQNAGCIANPTKYGSCDPTSLDHAVLIVGYGVQDDIPYWVIKNSWGDAWGEEGYYRLLRGVNECGVANFVIHSVAKAL